MPESTTRARLQRAGARALALVAAASALLGGSVALAPAAAAAPPETGAITITAPASVTAGDTFDVTIAAAAAVDVFAYDLTITYDPALLSYTDATGTFPDGGFDSVSTGTGTVTFTHTRLGSSPGLAGALSLVTFGFTALSAGPATITVDGATFISSTNETTTLSEPISTITTVAALPTQTPLPSPSITESPSETPAPASDGESRPLASTGSDATVWIVAGFAAAALVALGVVLVLRRRAVTR